MAHAPKGDANRVLPAVPVFEPVFVPQTSDAQVVLAAVPLSEERHCWEIIWPWCLCGEANVCRCAENTYYEVHGHAHLANEILKCTTVHRARVLAYMDAVYESKKSGRALGLL